MTASPMSSQHLVNRSTAVWPRRSRSWSQEVPIRGRRVHIVTTSNDRCHGGPQSQAHPARLSQDPSPHSGGIPGGPTLGRHLRVCPVRARAPHIPSPWQQRPRWGAAPRRGAGPSTLRPRSLWGARASAPEWSRPWGHHIAGSTRGRPDPRRPPQRCSAPPNAAAAASKPPQP